jgi:hypothetical protein
MKIKRFEDIEAWKQGRELAKDIYAVTGKGEFAKDYGLKDQIRRAAVSVMANIAEGFDANSDDEFVRFLEANQRFHSVLEALTLDFGLRTIDLGPRTGLWTSDYGHWTVDIGHWTKNKEV